MIVEIEPVLLKEFRRKLAKGLSGSAPSPKIGFVAFGDGGHSGKDPIQPSDEQLGLKNELLRKPVSEILQEDEVSVTGVGQVSENELIGSEISEVALLDTDGNAIAVKNFAPKPKESGEIFEISVRVRF